jgi:hypothetical protein
MTHLDKSLFRHAYHELVDQILGLKELADEDVAESENKLEVQAIVARLEKDHQDLKAWADKSIPDWD